MVRCLCGGSLGCELTAIVGIARPCVAHCDELIMKCLNVLHVDPFPSMSSSYILCIRVRFSKKDFMFGNSSSHKY